MNSSIKVLMLIQIVMGMMKLRIRCVCVCVYIGCFLLGPPLRIVKSHTLKLKANSGGHPVPCFSSRDKQLLSP